MSHVNAFSCILTFNFIYFDVSVVWYFSNFLPLFLSYSSFYVSCIMALKHKSTLSRNPLRIGALLLFLHLTALLLTFDSVMRRPNRTSLRTFHDAAFFWNAKSFCQTSLTLTCLLSSTVRVGSHYVAPRSRVLP